MRLKSRRDCGEERHKETVGSETHPSAAPVEAVVEHIRRPFVPERQVALSRGVGLVPRLGAGEQARPADCVTVASVRVRDDVLEQDGRHVGVGEELAEHALQNVGLRGRGSNDKEPFEPSDKDLTVEMVEGILEYDGREPFDDVIAGGANIDEKGRFRPFDED